MNITRRILKSTTYTYSCHIYITLIAGKFVVVGIKVGILSSKYTNMRFKLNYCNMIDGVSK